MKFLSFDNNLWLKIATNYNFDDGNARYTTVEQNKFSKKIMRANVGPKNSSKNNCLTVSKCDRELFNVCCDRDGKKHRLHWYLWKIPQLQNDINLSNDIWNVRKSLNFNDTVKSSEISTQMHANWSLSVRFFFVVDWPNISSSCDDVYNFDVNNVRIITWRNSNKCLAFRKCVQIIQFASLSLW